MIIADLKDIREDVHIPDIRQLQHRRIEGIEQLEQYEEHLFKYRVRARYLPRLAIIPNKELVRIYSLAFPLTFTKNDPMGDISGETYSSRWTPLSRGILSFPSSQPGAMHLTTQQGLQELIETFEQHQIPIENEEAYQTLCEIEETKPPAISVPHNWCDDKLSRFQFIAYEERLFAIPFIVIDEIGEVSKVKKGEHNNTLYEVTEFSEGIQIRTAIGYFCHDHLNDIKKGLEEKVDKEDNERIGEKTLIGNITTKSKRHLIKLDEPSLFYDPKWLGYR